MNSRNKKLLLILIVLMLFVSIGKETYALFTSEVSSIVQNYSTGTLKLSYSNVSINLNNVYPMSDTDGMNSNETTITITNVGTLAYKFNVILEPMSNSTLDSSFIKVSMDGENPAILSSDSNIIIRDVILNPGSSRTFTIKLWIPDTVSSSDILGKKFNANLTSSGIAVKDVEDSDGTVLIGGEPLYDYIKNNADTTTTIDFSKTSDASSTNGIYMTTNTEGNIPVYYYRGAVDNNVLFANFCWKIIRTTETGGVKLIYNGVPSNGQCNNTGSATTIGNIQFNTNYNSPAYVGYMYNTVYTASSKDITTLTGSIVFGNDATYDASTGKYTLKDTKTLTDPSSWGTEYSNYTDKYHYTCFSSGTSCQSVYYIHIIYSEDKYTYYFTLTNGKKPVDLLNEMFEGDINVKESNAKVKIDTWYKTNMTSYTLQLEDTGFCNDRTYYNLSTSGWNKDYSNYNKWLYFGSVQRLLNRKLSLVCPRQIDKFTVSTDNGNGELTYPVGMITAEEMAFAGGVVWQTNTSYYLYNGFYNWSFSPSLFYDWGAGEIDLRSSGIVAENSVTGSLGGRPVVSLKQGITVTGGGLGTATEPYIVK